MAGPYADGSALKADIIEVSGREDRAPKVDTFLRLCEIMVQRELGMRFTKTVVTGTFDGTTDLLELPADCIRPDALWITSPARYEVELVSEQQFATLQAQQEGSLLPIGGVSEGLSIRLSTTPAAGTAYELRYTAGLPAIQDGTLSADHWLLENGPDVLLYGSLMHLAADVPDDVALTRYTGIFQPLLQSLKKLEWRARLHGRGFARSRRPTP